LICKLFDVPLSDEFGGGFLFHESDDSPRIGEL